MSDLSQADKLMTWTLFDNHDRTWAATVNKNGHRAVTRTDGKGHQKTPHMGFVSPPRPLGWEPPFPELVPPASVLRQDGLNPTALRIDYDAWEGEAVDAMKQYQQSLEVLAQERYPSNPGEALAKLPPDLIRMAGPRPLHPDFVLAMKAGNRWCLGLKKKDGTPYPRDYKPGFFFDEDGSDRGLLSTIASLRVVRRGDAADLSRFVDDESDEDVPGASQFEGSDRFQDLEDEIDPHATGGKRVPVRGKGGKFVKATT